MSVRETCNEKRWYKTKQLAKDGAARDGRTFNAKLYPYRCSHCAGYHLTTMTPAEYRRWKRRKDEG